eukprot:CAMPEP_0201714542 /NCGR_PEP_ID=MMETSP0593-20130828/979_1 /ASSEMBLY_ACC=CAM_ASM_000672 /TAXON_ID=267983 /ORGANISM="Skeletonema japonicum, Strain CCMP2506" /LENGTH=390 /DNA_ID=CAMNT_0048203829 /DNA_START=222 /DNA_END=1394 /DNA_ORIENTATION=-
MKLPLFSKKDVPDDNKNNDISRDQECGEGMEAATMMQQAQCSWGAPSSQNATYNYGGGMRRVQSANASRPRGAVGATSGRNTPLETAQKSRSHSQEARTTRNANSGYEVVVAPPPPSEQLPIPQCKNTLLEIARTKSDQTDLRRMYDYATWSMYDRIVSARNKKRMSLEADNPDDLLHKGEKEPSSSSSAASKNTDKPSSSATTTATTSCNSSFTSSPNNNQLAAIACKGPGITKTSGNDNNIKTTATIKKVQASTSSNTSNTASASAATTTATSSTQAMSTASIYKQQAAATTTTSSDMNATQTSLHHKLRSIKKSFSSHDTDSSQGGTAATESTSLESEDSSGSSRSGCNSPATFPGCMVSAGRSSETSHRKMSQGSEDDHFIFQMDM